MDGSAGSGVLVADTVRNGDLYVITHPELWPQVSARHAAIEAAFTAEGAARRVNMDR